MAKGLPCVAHALYHCMPAEVAVIRFQCEGRQRFTMCVNEDVRLLRVGILFEFFRDRRIRLFDVLVGRFPFHVAPEIDTVDVEWPPFNHDLFRAFGFFSTPQSPGHLEQFGFHSGTDVVCEDAGFPAVLPNDLASLLRALSVVCLTMTYNAPVNTVKSPKPVDYTTHCVCVVMVGSTRKG